MLSTPKHGWSNITIGSWSDRCSYLDDVPFMLLDALQDALSGKTPIAIEFDAEGYGYTIVFSLGVIHIVTETEDGYKLASEEIFCKELAKELIADIRKDINVWTIWQDFHETTEEQQETRKQLLLIIGAGNPGYLYPG